MYQAVRKEFFNPSFFSPYYLFFIVFWVASTTYITHQLLFQGDGINFLYLLMLIQVTPFLIQFGKQQFNFLGFTLFNHFFTFSVPKFNQVKELLATGGLSPESALAVKELIHCTLILISSYYFFRTFIFYSFREKEKYQLLSLSRTQLIAVALYVLLMPIIIDFLPSWAIMFHFAAVAADMVLLMCSHSPNNERLSRFIRLGVFVSAVLYFIKTGFLTMVGNLAGYLFIASCLQRKYKILFIPVILTILGSAVQVVKSSYRDAIASTPQLSYQDRLNVLGGLLFSHFVEKVDIEEEEESTRDVSEAKDLGDSLLHGFSRVGDDSFERVLSWTPSLVPFWNGSSYESIPYLFIPRIIWHDKPSRHMWNKFGRSYGILSDDDFSTSVGVNYFAEGYMNFGFIGMYFVAFIMGLIISATERISYYFLGGYFYFTFMAFLMPVMAYATDLGSVIQSVMIVSAVLFVFRAQFLKMAQKDDYS